MLSLVSTLFGFVAVFLFAFILWRQLKEDYPHETIFKFTLVIFCSAGISLWIASVFLESFVFWAVILASSTFSYLYIRRLGLRFFEIIDGIALASLFFLVFIYIGQLVKFWPTLDYFVLAKAFSALSLILIFSYFIKSYRRFRWYPSGKVGFAGLAVLSLFFLSRTFILGVKQFFGQEVFLEHSALPLSIEVVNVIIPKGLVFDIIISLGLALVLIRVLYKRSGR